MTTIDALDLTALGPHLSDADRARIAESARNARIRRDYPALRDRHGRGAAMQRLAVRESVSVWTVEALVKGMGRKSTH